MILDHSHVLELRQLLKGPERTTQPKALIDDLLEAKLYSLGSRQAQADAMAKR